MSAGDRLFFNAYDGENTKLWSSGGSSDDLIPLMTVDYYANNFYQLGELTFFRSGDTETGMELYVTDNTSSGTHLFMDINEGPDDGAGRILGVQDGLLYFVGNDSIHGSEIWTTDGTVQGTHMVKDINPSGDGTDFNGGRHYWLNGEVYFQGNDETHGSEVWVSDGTTNGTRLLADNNPFGDCYLEEAVVKNSELFFTTIVYGTGSFLWKTDGSESGTQQIKQIGAASTFGKSLTIYNNKVYFEVGSYFENQGDIWVSDGTEAGTMLTIENASIAGVMNDEFYYMGISPNNYYAIYKTSGAMEDEEMLIETHEAMAWTYPSHVYEVWNDKLYFLVRYDDPAALYVWSYLYYTDGTPEGSQMQMASGGEEGLLIRTGEGLKKFNNGLYFIGSYSDVGEELYAYQPLAGNVSQTTPDVELTVFPNPTADIINIRSGEIMSGTIHISNSQGQLITEKKVNQQQQMSISVENYPSGNYFIHVSTEKGHPMATQFTVK
jgi:ELWxxDGT repeat protein